jgi:hypothetical protein
MRRKQIPPAIFAVLPNSFQYGRPALIENIWRLEHPLAVGQSALRIGLHHAAAELIVSPVHGARFISVKVGAVACERDEIPQSVPKF